MARTDADPSTETPAKPDSFNGSGIPSVDVEYRRATEAFLQRNHEEAVRLMEDLASKCENTPHSASAHRLSGGMCMEVAWSTDDPDAKLSLTKNALSHAKKAAGLSPRNIEYAKFYAKLLHDLGNDEEVVEECERALSIENPEAFVDYIRSDLCGLIQESNVSIISRWMNGEELRGRRAVVDPIELRLVQSDGAEARVAAFRQAQTDVTEASSQPRNTAEVQEKEMKEQEEVTEASQSGDAAEEQQKETKEQEVTEASQSGDAAEKEIKEQDVTDASQTGDVAEEQEKETKEQDVTDASQTSDTAEEQQKEIKEQDVTEASQPGDAAEKETKEQDVTEASQTGDAAEKEIKEQDVTDASQTSDTGEEQQKEGKEKDVTEASQTGDVAEKETKEQVVPEASQPRKKAKKSKKSKEQSMPQPVKSQSKSGKGTRAVSPEVPDWVLLYWDSLSSETKKDLLTIKVSDLKKYLSPSKDRTLREVVEEAIFFEECFKNSWKFWSCCGCSKKLGTSDLLIDHAREEHWAKGVPKTEKRLIPESPDDEWLDYLRFSSWEPVDLDAATKMIEELPKPDGSSPRKRKPGDGDTLYDWPLSNDPERNELLPKIYSLFEKFYNNSHLTSDLVRKVTEYAVAELRGFACGSAAEQEVNQTPVCIRLLGAPELKRIMKFLEDVSKSVPLTSSQQSYPDDPLFEVDDLYVIEKIRPEEDGSLLVIEERSLPGRIYDVPDASDLVFDDGVILDSDALLSWIYTGASSPPSARLATWKRAMILTTAGHQKAFDLLKTENEYILTFCKRKRELFGYEEALMALEQLCLEEGKKKDGQDFDKLLEERCEKKNINSAAENYVMTRVLERAKSIKSGEISFEEAYDGGITFHPQDWRKKEHRHEADSYVEASIQKLKDALIAEVRQGDITMMGVVSSMKRVQHRMAENCCYDFRAILIPFIRSFLKAQLEDVALIEATKKADAMAEELISEESKKPEKKKGKTKDQKKKK